MASAAVAAALVLGFTVIVVVAQGGAALATQCLPGSVTVSGTVPASAGLDTDQVANATTIVSQVVARRMPSRAAVIAVAAAMQESGMHNIAYGDRDSVGLFQQRPSQGWGTFEQLMDPVYATDAFLDHLAAVENWPVLPVTVAAQAVQHSAFPDAYAQWETLATVVVTGLLGRDTTPGDGNQSAGDLPGLYAEGGALLTALRSQLPATYQGGAVGFALASGRTTAQGLADLTAHTAALPGTLPGTLLVDLGAADHLTGPQQPAYTAQVRHALNLAAGRTVYWLTEPGPAGKVPAAALRELAARDDRLQLVDVAAAATVHPEWLQGSALTAAGVDGIATMVLNALAANSEGDPTAADSGACADGLGGYSSIPVPDCAFTLINVNPRSCADAIRWGLAQEDGPPQWYRRCLSFVAHAYGYRGSGVDTAYHFWQAAPDKHVGDPNPPAGALVFWTTSHPAGHVALSVRGGQVLTNDYAGHGVISQVSIATLTSAWHARYLGWTAPNFPKGGV